LAKSTIITLLHTMEDGGSAEIAAIGVLSQGAVAETTRLLCVAYEISE
jgi:hypothetical protein